MPPAATSAAGMDPMTYSPPREPPGSGSAPAAGASTPTIAAAVATVTAARTALPRLRAFCSMPRNMHG
ncbi:hypothetical protein EES46_10835 [Streptomyces sp. ADI98-10]|nr:hypothetical protein EES46_10835 [Streptomyces sp. ADI98-10]